MRAVVSESSEQDLGCGAGVVSVQPRLSIHTVPFHLSPITALDSFPSPAPVGALSAAGAEAQGT